MTKTFINDLISTETRVMEHQGRMGRDIGNVSRIFGGLDGMEIGEPQGEDSLKGASQWWPLIKDGEKIGEVRDDASGVTVHIESDEA